MLRVFHLPLLISSISSYNVSVFAWNLVLVADANMKLDIAKKNSILVFIKFKCKKLYTYYTTYKLFICL